MAPTENGYALSCTFSFRDDRDDARDSSILPLRALFPTSNTYPGVVSLLLDPMRRGMEESALWPRGEE
jgi:hypothetical protein